MVDIGEKLYPLSFHSNQTSKQKLQFTNHTRIRIVGGEEEGGSVIACTPTLMVF